MRSLALQEPPVSRLWTTCPSWTDVWVKAPRPLTSPRAKMCAMLVLRKLVGGDEPPRVGGHTGGFQTQVLAVGRPAQTQKQMAARHRHAVAVLAEPHLDALACRRNPLETCVEVDGDALGLEEGKDSGRKLGAFLKRPAGVSAE